MKRASIILFFILLPTLLFPSTTGIVKGVVQDKTSLQPLNGATIKVLDTQIEATSDEEGNFIILNAAVGLCKIKCGYEGYHDVLMEQIQVHAGIITELNIEMEPSAIEFDESQTMTPEPPLINKDQIQKTDIYTAQEIQSLPMQDIKSLVSVSSSTVNDEGVLHFHGGRQHETAYIIDGIIMNDLFWEGNRTLVNTQSIEELQVQANSFDPEYGNYMSGLVNITTKSGTPDYHFSIEAITDEFLPRDKEILGTYSYAYNNYNLSISGSLIPKSEKLTFYGAFQRLYMGDRDPRQNWADGRTYIIADPFLKGVYLDTSSVTHYIRDTLGVTLNENIKPGNWENQQNFLGKLSFQLTKNIKFNFSGIINNQKLQDTYFEPDLVANMMVNSEHSPRIETKTRVYSFTFNHSISNNTFYELRADYYNSFREIGDGVFFDDLFAYGDPAKNPFLNINLDPNSTYYGMRIPGIPLTNIISRSWAGQGYLFNRYIKNDQTRKSIHFDLISYRSNHLMKYGFEYNYYTLRYYELGAYPGVVGLANKLTAYEDAITAGEMSEEYAWYSLYNTSARANYYGYDFRGNEVDEGDWFLNDPSDPQSIEPGRPDAPKHPITIGAYIQDKIELKDLIINLGVRLDYINPNDWQLIDTYSPFNHGQSAPLNNIFDEGDIEDSDTYTLLSPRIGFAYSLMKTTVFYAHFSKFHQLHLFSNLYLSKNYLNIMLIDNPYYDNIGFPNASPEKTTSYEMGFKHNIGNIAAISITGFHKESSDLVHSLNFSTDIQEIGFKANVGSRTVKGFDFTIKLNRYHKFSAILNYTLSYADGLGSDSPYFRNITWLQGPYTDSKNPLDYDQRHTGNMIIDYRLGKGEGIVLGNKHPFENFGINVSFYYNSGMPYTAVRIIGEPFFGDVTGYRPLSPINELRTPSNYYIDLKIDKTFNLPLLRSKLNVYVWIINLFNRANIVNVYPATGVANANGWLFSADGQQWLQSATVSDVYLYTRRELNPFNYGVPRQIRLGIRLEI